MVFITVHRRSESDIVVWKVPVCRPKGKQHGGGEFPAKVGEPRRLPQLMLASFYICQCVNRRYLLEEKTGPRSRFLDRTLYMSPNRRAVRGAICRSPHVIDIASNATGPRPQRGFYGTLTPIRFKALRLPHKTSVGSTSILPQIVIDHPVECTC